MIRLATEADAPALLEIYSHYVKNTAVTFEYEVPTQDVFRERIRHTLSRYPYFISQQEGKIVGYAYAGAFHARKAYDWSAEVSIYLADYAQHQGHGRALYEALEQALKMQNITNLYACIAFPEKEDPYLDRNSAAFHHHMGYVLAGLFRKCGYKFGRWYDMIWMQKFIGSHSDRPQSVPTFGEVKEAFSNLSGIR